MSTSSPAVQEIQGRLTAAATVASKALLHNLTPLFQRKIALAQSYEDLFSETPKRQAQLDELYALVEKSARVMMCGRGGAGKTTIMRAAVLAAIDKGAVPVFLDLKKWSGAQSAHWAARRRSGSHELLDSLLAEFADAKTSVSELDALPPGIAKVLFIDGLNEVPSEVSTDILAAADNLVRLLLNTKVLVADRLTRRALRERRWTFGLVDDLSDDAVVSAWKTAARPLAELRGMRLEQRSLIKTPFFLDRALHGNIRGTRVETLKALLRSHGGLAEQEVECVSLAAYTLYLEGKSRSFRTDTFTALVGDVGLLARLGEAGLVVPVADQTAAFSHHWYHDFLAACYVASKPELWGYEAFNAITFDANSSDSIAFVLEQLPVNSTDGFLRAVYDWNIYAAGYALAEIDGVGASNVDRDTRFALLSMLAERRFDRLYATAERANDALRLFVTADARQLRDAANLQELIEVVREHGVANDSLSQWQALFVRDSRAALGDAEMEQLRDADSFVGWTVANRMKRIALTPFQLEKLLDFARAETSNVLRWRAVHVLGAFPSPNALEVLLGRLKFDSDHWVRYGAIRSLVEMASQATPELRHEIFGRLSQDVEAIRSSALAVREFSRSVFLQKEAAPEFWAEEVGRVMGALIDVAEDSAEMDRWSRLASDVRMRHAA